MERLPSVVIVGRPNVGKSTLFNRLAGQRRAIVGNEPGITRDRLYGTAEWLGKTFEVVDTGGMLVGEGAEIPALILEQAHIAIQQADQVLLVVDGRSEITAADQELAQLLRRTGKPLMLAVNKMDSPSLWPAAQAFYALGISRLFPISAEHGLGLDEMLEEITAALPTAASISPRGEEIQVALIGHPNVGKSTLLNQMANCERAIVSETPGTTRDAVDTLVERDGVLYRLVDTAGIRRKGKTHEMAETLSVVMARRHIRLCDIALLLVDALEGITALDATIGGYAHQSGKSVIVLVNKWDLVKDQKAAAQRFADQASLKLKFLNYAPKLFVSAKSGQGIQRLFREIQQVASSRCQRIPTAELNRFLRLAKLERVPLPAARRMKIYYLTQAAVSPPTFILFTDRKGPLHYSLERFLINQLRRKYGFKGTPIVIQQRLHH
ncbi:MAG: ribosome biogenesis GTPase Der [Acidobacteria bacterium]|nr:ribosome biogenesis GTPase Der [Acidobacteriota bacterium]